MCYAISGMSHHNETALEGTHMHTHVMRRRFQFALDKQLNNIIINLYILLISSISVLVLLLRLDNLYMCVNKAIAL